MQLQYLDKFHYRLSNKPNKEEIQRMVQKGMIPPIDEPNDWCAPMVTRKAFRKASLRGHTNIEQFRSARKISPY